MRIYSIFEPASGPARPDDPRSVIFLKEGFSWPALLVPLLWLLYHRMWMLAAAYIGVSLLVSLPGYWLGPQGVAAALIGLGSGLIMACEANGLRRWHLSRNGYRQVATIAAPDLPEAELRYFSARPAAAPAPAPAASMRLMPGAERRQSAGGWGFMPVRPGPGAGGAPETRT